MYTPPAYAEKETPFLHKLMQEWRFATLVSNGPNGPMATHLPFMTGPGGAAGLGVLTSHIARNNPQCERLTEAEVLVIFQGPHAFVSVDWYDNHQTYPTWNYGAIHAYGRVKLEHNPEALRALLHQTINTFDQPKTDWAFDEIPEEMTAPRLHAIIGIEIGIARLEGKLKFNQDKSEADRAGVRTALAARPEGRDTAKFMERLDRQKAET